MSLVYFVSARASKSSESLVNKLDTLLEVLGIRKLARPAITALIKVHMGAPLCTRYLRPFYVRRVVDRLRELNANPIVTDTTGLDLDDPRGTADKYLRVATMHGFTPETLGAPIVIGDGDYGNNVFRVKVDGHRFREVSLAVVIKQAEALINLTHFKGHELVGIGGAVKNLAVGLAAKESKFHLHYAEKPRVEPRNCDGCGVCVEACPVNAIETYSESVRIDPHLCIGCMACKVRCSKRAIKVVRRKSVEEVQLRMADLGAAVMKTIGRDRLFNLNFLVEVGWLCDCEHREQGWSDLPIVPDIGILASSDPVAIDVASVDLVNQAPGIPGSKAEEVGVLAPNVDKFRAIYPGVDWKRVFVACEDLGIGSTSYQLINLEASRR